MQTEKNICKEPLNILRRKSIKKKDLLPSLFDYSERDEDFAEMVFNDCEDEWCYSDKRKEEDDE